MDTLHCLSQVEWKFYDGQGFIDYPANIFVTIDFQIYAGSKGITDDAIEQFLKMDFGTARLIKQFMNNRLISMCEKAYPGKVKCPYYC